MAAWHFDLFLAATGPIDVGPLQSRLDSMFASQPSPSPRLRLWGSMEGDRIDFWADHTPVQLLARFDLRAPSDGFRTSILTLADELSLKLVTVDDTEIAATDEALRAAIESSAASEFVRNPPAEDQDEE